MNRKRCKVRNHHDRRLRRGQHYECTACGDVFPCRGECPHIDCIVATGRELPEWVGPEARAAVVAELALLYPDHSFSIATAMFASDGLPAIDWQIMTAGDSENGEAGS